MAEADPEHSCHFHWDILHPFIPWRRLNATFYDGSPTVTQWKVTLQPLRRTINCWTFEFFLGLDRSFDEREEILVNKVEVTIFINDTPITDEEVSHFRFKPGNLFAYRFQTEVNTWHELNADLLVITITLHLPGEVTLDQYNNGYDINCLSNDLRLLCIQTDPMYSNMRLRSTDGRIHKVHSCIMHARWNDFYRLNPFRVGEVEINISSQLLLSILLYLYSGKVYLPQPSPPLLFTELFQVIHRYKLYHLYKTLVLNDLHQKLLTARYAHTEYCSFPLTYVLGGMRNPFSLTWHINRNSPFASNFTIKVGIWNGPWLSYSLQSLSPILVYAQVNLDIGKTVVESPGAVARTTYQPVHQCDYTILPHAVIQSGAVLFLGCRETFGDTNTVNRYGQRREVQYFVRFTLRFTDGKTVYLILSSNTTVQNVLEDLNLLADHLLDLRRTLLDADLQILPHSEHANEIAQELYYSTKIHKVIFAARVKNWRAVFDDIEQAEVIEPDEMPDVATSILSNEALFFVLNYIYTSRGFPIPDHLFLEIEDFATKGNCDSLLNSINFRRVFDNPDE